MLDVNVTHKLIGGCIAIVIFIVLEVGDRWAMEKLYTTYPAWLEISNKILNLIMAVLTSLLIQAWIIK